MQRVTDEGSGSSRPKSAIAVQACHNFFFVKKPKIFENVKSERAAANFQKSWTPHVSTIISKNSGNLPSSYQERNKSGFKIQEIQETLFKVDILVYNIITLAMSYFVDKQDKKT